MGKLRAGADRAVHEPGGPLRCSWTCFHSGPRESNEPWDRHVHSPVRIRRSFPSSLSLEGQGHRRRGPLGLGRSMDQAEMEPLPGSPETPSRPSSAASITHGPRHTGSVPRQRPTGLWGSQGSTLRHSLHPCPLALEGRFTTLPPLPPPQHLPEAISAPLPSPPPPRR